MDKVKNCLAVACLAYGRGDTETAIRAFLQGMEACGQEGLEQVVQFLRPPVAAINSDVPAAENTLAPALHSDEQAGVKPLDIAKPVEAQPVVTAIPEPVPSTITSLSGSLLDDGDEELESRAEAEDDLDEDDLEDEEDDEEESEEDEDEEGGFQLSISSATPVRLKQVEKQK